MNNNYKSILDLVGDIYESSINPSRWKVVMEKLAAITGSKSAVLVVHDSEIKQLSYLHAYGLPKLGIALLNSPLGVHDPALKIMREHPPGKAVNMYRLDDRTKVPKVAQALISSFSDLFYFGGVNCFNDGTWHAGIGLHRTREKGEFEPEILELLEDLVPHLQRSLRIQKEFTRLQLHQEVMQSELDRHIIGLILLDEENQPLYINPMARRILERHRAIALTNNALHAYNKNEDNQLQQAIQQARKGLPETVNGGQAFGLSHPEQAMPLALLVVPVAQGGGNIAEGLFDSRAKVAVYLTDPDEHIPISQDALISTYGLTEREASVAVAIANGYEVGQVAEMNDVSVQTVRSQVKSIFQKTGVNRQVDLIRLLLGGPFMYGR